MSPAGAPPRRSTVSRSSASRWRARSASAVSSVSMSARASASSATAAMPPSGLTRSVVPVDDWMPRRVAVSRRYTCVSSSTQTSAVPAMRVAPDGPM